jgi:hypothetical protein
LLERYRDAELNATEDTPFTVELTSWAGVQRYTRADGSTSSIAASVAMSLTRSAPSRAKAARALCTNPGRISIDQRPGHRRSPPRPRPRRFELSCKRKQRALTGGTPHELDPERQPVLALEQRH